MSESALRRTGAVEGGNPPGLGPEYKQEVELLQNLVQSMLQEVIARDGGMTRY